MKKFRLIQIGDMHWPQYKDTSLVDLKDTSFPNSVFEQININPIQNSMRGVLEFCQSGIDAVLICGDLTSWGDINGYLECIDYLRKSLFETCSKRAQIISVVPGNHDIDRKECDPDGVDVFRKFIPLQTAWQPVAADILPAGKVGRLTIQNAASCSFTVFSINSCIGCGEKRYLPEQISSDLSKLLDKVALSFSRDKSFDLLGEILDTPAFSKDDIDAVHSHIHNMTPEELPIVLSHHNILPQKKPRVSLYSEVINAGYIRSRLSRCGRPVIYCHGHIHQDPVEIVSASDLTVSSKLISIAVSEFKDGFNLVELQYGEKNYALGCIIRQMRIGDDGALEPKKVIRIPLRAAQEREKVGHSRIPEFLSSISSEVRRFNDIVLAIRANTGIKVQEPTVADVLLECEWLGLVQITNREEKEKHWQIKGLI